MAGGRRECFSEQAVLWKKKWNFFIDVELELKGILIFSVLPPFLTPWEN